MACGRLLRDQESKRLRLGPVCRERLRGLLTPRPREHRTPHTPDITADQLAFDLDEYDDEDDDLDWLDEAA